MDRFGLGGLGGGDAEADPATVAPPGAILYVNAEVQPEGERREQALAAAGKLLDTPDPEQRIYELLDEQVRVDQGSITFRSGVAPWLGRRMGLFLIPSAGREPEGAVITASRDNQRAEEFIERATGPSRDLGLERDYKGVAYWVQRDGDARGMVGDFAVEGSEAGFRAVVDASQGASLAESERYRRVAERAGRGLAVGFLDFPALARAAERDPTIAPDEREGLRLLGRLLAAEPIIISLDAKADALTLEVSARQPGIAAAIPDPATVTDLLGRLPGNSWIAIASPQIGKQIQFSLDASSTPDPEYDRNRRELESATGVDLERDVFPALGDFAGFGRGSSRLDLNGAVVIELTDTSPIARLLRRGEQIGRRDGSLRPTTIAGADEGVSLPIPGSPQPVEVALVDDRLVVSSGDAAARDAVEPG